MAWTKAKTAVVIGAVALLTIGTAVVATRTVLPASDPSLRGETTVELSGTPGASFTGEYLQGTKRVAISGTLPWSLKVTNLVRLEIRKADVNDALGLTATRKGGWPFYSSVSATPGGRGLILNLEGGGNVVMIP